MEEGRAILMELETLYAPEMEADEFPDTEADCEDLGEGWWTIRKSWASLRWGFRTGRARWTGTTWTA